MMRTLRPRTQGRKQAPPPPPKPAKVPVTDPVEVYCRLRPPESKNDPICVAPLTCTTVQLSNPDPLQAFKSGNIKEMQYTFKFVFDEATSQKALFDHIALPLVSDLLHGKNGILFTYGVTGSGKTFTMTGTPQNGGLLPRSLDVIFNTIKDFQSRKYIFKPDKMNGFDVQTEADAAADRHKDLNIVLMKTPNPKTPRKREQDSEERIPDITKVDNIDEDNSYAVFVSYIEIYNNYVYDLLEDYLIDPIRPKPPQSKILREDANHNMYVHGCTEVEVKSTEEAFEVFYKGQRKRRVAHTTLNTESSRSHSVFTIRLVQAPLDPIGQEVFQDKNTVCVSQLSLVDLAGSERTVRTKNSGDRLREAGNINNSLMVLRACIEILRENQANGTNKMVPYRDSKLTHLFKNYFDGEGKVRMIVCVNPCGDDYDENIHVMRFAELTQEVQVTRPTAVIFDLGLTPGRRRANQLYKNLLEKETAAQPEFEETPAPVACLFSLGPSFPPSELCDPTDEALLVNLMAFLDERIRSRATAQTDLHAKQMSFRAQLDSMEKENLFLKQRINDLEALVERSKTIERRLVKVEYEKDSLERKLSAFERAKKTLEHELDEKEMLLNQGKFEKEKLKAHMQGRINTERERVTRNMEKKYREHQAELENKVWMKNAKLRALKEIVSDKWEPDPNSSRLRAVHSDSKLNESDDTREPRRVGRSVSPPQLKSIPVANPRHRRSRSAGGEMWIAHNPVGNVELGTVFQPMLKKKRSVTKLNVKDIVDGEVANYMLTHQEQDVAGDIETRLYKANVVPSAGGGAQVIFNDVETLRQISPQDGKKRSLERHAKDGVGCTDVELKCATGIEGHSYKKKRC